MKGGEQRRHVHNCAYQQPQCRHQFEFILQLQRERWSVGMELRVAAFENLVNTG
jgi:hypothetical protein